MTELSENFFDRFFVETRTALIEFYRQRFPKLFELFREHKVDWALQVATCDINTALIFIHGRYEFGFKSDRYGDICFAHINQLKPEHDFDIPLIMLIGFEANDFILTGIVSDILYPTPIFNPFFNHSNKKL